MVSGKKAAEGHLQRIMREGRLKSVIFDLDGTLVRADIPFGPYRERLGIQGDVLAGIEALPEDEQGKKWEIIMEYEREMEKHSRPAPGAYRLLNLLRENDIRTGVITRSTGNHARLLLERHNLRVDIYIGREDAPPKPQPDGILYLLEKLNVMPENAIMVGDFLWDILAGKRAGLFTVLVVLEHSRPYIERADLTVESLEELAEILKTAGGN